MRQLARRQIKHPPARELECIPLRATNVILSCRVESQGWTEPGPELANRGSFASSQEGGERSTSRVMEEPWPAPRGRASYPAFEKMVDSLPRDPMRRALVIAVRMRHLARVQVFERHAVSTKTPQTRHPACAPGPTLHGHIRGPFPKGRRGLKTDICHGPSLPLLLGSLSWLSSAAAALALRIFASKRAISAPAIIGRDRISFNARAEMRQGRPLSVAESHGWHLRV